MMMMAVVTINTVLNKVPISILFEALALEYMAMISLK